MNRSVLEWMIVSLAVLTLAACGGADGSENSCAEPVADISGSWKITETATDNTCDEGLETPYPLKITQSGNDLSILSPNLGQTFEGKICGAAIRWKGKYTEDSGTITLDPVKATLAGERINGTIEWRWNDGFDGCSGNTQFFGTRQ